MHPLALPKGTDTKELLAKKADCDVASHLLCVDQKAPQRRQTITSRYALWRRYRFIPASGSRFYSSIKREKLEELILEAGIGSWEALLLAGELGG